jgi:hypothetical protein
MRFCGNPGSANRFEIHVTDLSLTGIGMTTRVCLNIDQQVAITIAGLAAVEARVAWVPGHSRGCAFERALHVAVFDHLVGQYRKDC